MKKTGAVSVLTKEHQEQVDKVANLQAKYDQLDQAFRVNNTRINDAEKIIKDATQWRDKSNNKATKKSYQDTIDDQLKIINTAKSARDKAKTEADEAFKILEAEKIKLPVIEEIGKKKSGDPLGITGVKLRKRPTGDPSSSKKTPKDDPANVFNVNLLTKVKGMRKALTDDEGDFEGEGVITKHSYTVKADGTFGSLMIDLELLKTRHILKVKRKNKLIINQDVDEDTVRLLTQRFFSTKKYSDRSKDIFTQLVKLAELPVELRSTKYKLITGGCGSCEGSGSVYMFNKPEEAIDRLEILIGSITAGNNNKNVKNEMQSVMDYLLKSRKLTKAQHKLLFDTYILSR